MSNYFYDMIPAEEFAKLPYLPTVSEFVDWMAGAYADSPAVCDKDKTYTYSEFAARIARRRAFIEAAGLPKGSHIAIFDRNSLDAIELFLAVTSAGYVAMNLPASLPAPAVAGSCRKFDIAAIFVRDEFAPLCADLQGVKVFPASSMGETAAPVAKIDKEQPAAIFFTGGTTGTPKGAVLTHRALMRGCYNAIFKPGKVIGVHRYICLLPLSHVFGLIAGTMGCFYTGNLIHTCEDMKATIGQLPKIRPTILVIVPGICDILAGLCKMYGPQFLGGSLRLIISGAANVPPRLVETFTKMGVEFTFVDPDCSDEELEAAFRPNTKAVFGETIANPALKVLDIERFAKAAHDHGVPLIVDNTFATPIFCRPFEWGADIVTHSTTKYMDGHDVAVGGAIIDSGNFDWMAHADKFPGLCTPDESYHGITYAEKFGKEGAFITKATAQLMRDFGSIQSPQHAFYLNLGLESLDVRMRRHYENARKIAEFLDANDAVSWVEYPGLPGSTYYERAQKYMPEGTCGVISFGVKGGRAAAEQFMKNLKLCSIETHVADAHTCILHPANSTHKQLSDEELIASGVGPDLVRLSVGIENADDLIEDIAQALACVK